MPTEMDPVAILFNISAFVAGVSLLQQGAEKFTRSTIQIAEYLGLSEVLIALLTAGAEWEELTIVVLCLVQQRHELAIGLLVGSCIANVLGAYSLALVVQAPDEQITRSSKIYCVILLLVSAVVAILGLLNVLNQGAGIALLVLFVVYVIFASWSISRGLLAAPHDVEVPQPPGMDEEEPNAPVEEHEDPNTTQSAAAESTNETTPLVSQLSQQVSHGISQVKDKVTEARSRIKRVIAPIQKLIAGLTALPISAFVLSHSSINLADSMNIPDLVFGITILAFATNLPEKLGNITNDEPGSINLLIADIVGGNTFLLTLCLSIVLLYDTYTEASTENLVLPGLEALWMLGSAVLLMVLVLMGRPYKMLGWVLMAAYIVFFITELAPYVDLSKIRLPGPPHIPGIPGSPGVPGDPAAPGTSSTPTPTPTSF